jgi:hypothetical protein
VVELAYANTKQDQIAVWEWFLLAGPLIGNLVVWLLGLYLKANEPEQPPAPRTEERYDGREPIPMDRNNPGSALSDFVKAMREEEHETGESSNRTSNRSAGIPARIRIPSPKESMRTPLFPLSTPLSDDTGKSFRSSLGSHHLTRQDHSSADLTGHRSPGEPAQNFTSSASLQGIPNLRSRVNLPTPTSPGVDEMVRSSPHVRGLSTGELLFLSNEQNLQSSSVNMQASRVRAAFWSENDEEVQTLWEHED